MHFGPSVGEKRIAVWGLSFKPRTNDMREAPAIEIINGLLENGAQVTAYDPAAIPEAREIFGSRVEFAETNYDCLEGADALLVLTEWPLFRHPDLERMLSMMRTPVIFDGRNTFEPSAIRSVGFTYYGVGRP